LRRDDQGEKCSVIDERLRFVAPFPRGVVKVRHGVGQRVRVEIVRRQVDPPENSDQAGRAPRRRLLEAR
jgi:hypothetical protein